MYPSSIIGSKWIILKLVKENPDKKAEFLRVFRQGLETLLRDDRLKQTDPTDPEIEEIADTLLINARVKDYFDRLIYATAIYKDALLLTEDLRLQNIAQGEELPKSRKVIIYEFPSKCMERLNQFFKSKPVLDEI